VDIDDASVKEVKANEYIAVATTIIDASIPKEIADIINLFATFCPSYHVPIAIGIGEKLKHKISLPIRKNTCTKTPINVPIKGI